jgi:hypothetical protein
MDAIIIILFLTALGYYLYQNSENQPNTDPLIDCPSCRTTVSRFADKCLKCGHPIKIKREDGCLNIIGWVFVIGGFFFWPLWIISCLIFILSAVNKS